VRSLALESHPKVIALDLSNVPDLEYTALKTLTEAQIRQHERGIALWLVGLNPRVLATVQKSPLGESLGREAMHFNLETAVTKYVTFQKAASFGS
jgi:sulfate permease, SulP family